MPTLELILGVFAFFINTYFGLIVFFRNHRSWTHRLFLFLAVLIDLYIVVNYISLHPPQPTPESQLFWIRMVMAEVAFIGPTLLLLVHTFPRPALMLSRRKIGILGLLATITSFLALTPAVFTDIEYPGGQPVPTPGPAIPLFFFDFVGLILVSILLLIYKYRRAVGREKTQHFYFLVGVFLTFSLMALTTVVMTVILKFTGAVFLGPLVIVFMIGSIAYAIMKHQFLDIRLVIARTVAYVLIVFLMAALYTVLMVSFQTFVTHQPLSSLQFIVTTTLALLLMFSFQPLKRLLEHKTESIFYRRDYNQAELLKKTGKISTSILSLTKLVDGFIKVITDEMKISAIAVAIGREDRQVALYGSGHISLLQDAAGERSQPTSAFSAYTKLRSALTDSEDQVLVFDEIPESSTKTLMRNRALAVVLPLIVNNVYQGCLLLKEKQNGAPYSQEDIRTLQLLAPQVAIAVKNALSFEEIRHFNIVLKEEVDKATRKLKRANRGLKELDRLKDDFVSIASHELRTPMTAIKSYIWMALSGKGGKLSEKQRYYLERSYSSTDRLIKLVNDMLNISRIESHRISLDVKSVNVRALAVEMVAEVKARIDELGIKVSVAEECVDQSGKSIGAVPEVIADMDKIGEVLMNLIGNALKFTAKGGAIRISFEKDDDMLVTHVQDDGVGMTEETIKKLFQKFGLIKGSYKTNQNASQGTGLGLYISRSIVELHKGSIWADSGGVNHGSTFSFSLKLYSANELKKMQTEYGRRQDVGIIRTRTSFWV